jgi:large subunit ribosomal protein L22
MDVRAIAKFVRMSPRKVRLVTGMLRGLKLEAARNQLAFLPKAAALPVLKVLNSAAANAVNNFHLEEADLTVKTATADQGPALARWRARAMGRAAPIKKRMSHITIILTDGKDNGNVQQLTAKSQSEVKNSKSQNTEEKQVENKVQANVEKTKAVKKSTVKKAPAKKAEAK